MGVEDLLVVAEDVRAGRRLDDVRGLRINKLGYMLRTAKGHFRDIIIIALLICYYI